MGYYSNLEAEMNEFHDRLRAQDEADMENFFMAFNLRMMAIDIVTHHGTDRERYQYALDRITAMARQLERGEVLSEPEEPAEPQASGDQGNSALEPVSSNRE